MWWAHYLEQRPQDLARKVVIEVGDEWSLALDADSWDDVVSPDAARRWSGHGTPLELAVWSQSPACDLDQALVQEFRGSTAELVRKASSAGFTGSRSSSLQMAAQMSDGQGGDFMRALLVARTRTAVHFVSVVCPSAAWEVQDPTVRRAVNGFLLLAEPYGSAP